LNERSDPVGVLRRKLRTDAGQQPAMSDAVSDTLNHGLDRAELDSASSTIHDEVI
jgi:hypothetical protein